LECKIRDILYSWEEVIQMKRRATSIKAEDKNTRYFHAHFNARKQINSIRSIRDDIINIFSS